MMTVFPSMAFAAAIVYWLHRYFIAWFSEGLTSVIDLLLFVVLMVSMNTFLKNLRDG